MVKWDDEMIEMNNEDENEKKWVGKMIGGVGGSYILVILYYLIILDNLAPLVEMWNMWWLCAYKMHSLLSYCFGIC